jgi:hypothetical protein
VPHALEPAQSGGGYPHEIPALDERHLPSFGHTSVSSGNAASQPSAETYTRVDAVTMSDTPFKRV